MPEETHRFRACSSLVESDAGRKFYPGLRSAEAMFLGEGEQVNHFRTEQSGVRHHVEIAAATPASVWMISMLESGPCALSCVPCLQRSSTTVRSCNAGSGYTSRAAKWATRMISRVLERSSKDGDHGLDRGWPLSLICLHSPRAQAESFAPPHSSRLGIHFQEWTHRHLCRPFVSS